METQPVGGVRVLAEAEEPPHIPLVVDLPPISPIGSDGYLNFGSSQSKDISYSGSLSNGDTMGSSSLEVQDGGSRWGNKSLSKAEKIWHFSKELGVGISCVDEVQIQKIIQMGARDKAVHGGKVTLNGAK